MIAILTDPGVGGTFLTWSIYYLSGKTHYFSARYGTLDVPQNPLTTKNAHRFQSNVIWNTIDFKNFFPKILNQPTDECIYIHNFFKKIDTQDAVLTVCNYATKIVVLSLDQVLYKCKYTQRADVVPAHSTTGTLSDPDDIYNDFVLHFFKESKEQWDNQNLKNVWDKREFMALSFDPFEHDSILNYIDPATIYHQINTMDMWTNFDQSIKEMFDYLDTELNQLRYQLWLPIYAQWKQQHTNRLRFGWYFNTIIDNILNGVNLDLTRFNLDIQQEAAIQHELIYKHNLNFKTWELIKFTNTKQLHKLLEPNTHDLNNSLIRRLTT